MSRPGAVMSCVLFALLLAGCGPGAARRSVAPAARPGSGAPGVTPPRHGAGEVQRGLASWYGERHHGGPTASGERFDMHALTAAHRSLRFGTRVRITNEKNGQSVIVRINDRGPFGNRKRIIDVSQRAATELDMIDAGVVPVRVEVLSVPAKKPRR